MQNLLTVKQFSERHPAFSESSMRFHLFHRETNGLNKYVRTVGRKILIDEDGFFNEWIENQGSK